MSFLHTEFRGADAVVQIIYDKQIKKPVVVVIEPARSDGPGFPEFGNETSDTSLPGHVGEGSVAVVVEKLVTVATRHVKVDESVVVIVAGCDSHRIAQASEARFLGHVGKRTVAVVAKQPVPVNRITFFE